MPTRIQAIIGLMFLAALGRLAFAQQAKLVIFNDAIYSGGELEGETSATDESTGMGDCTHSNYQTCVFIGTPQGGHPQACVAGTGADDLISTQGDPGNYGVAGDGTATCSCGRTLRRRRCPGEHGRAGDYRHAGLRFK